ncbi:hypothetical protein CapIbe_010510 [Capra ibex]
MWMQEQKHQLNTENSEVLLCITAQNSKEALGGGGVIELVLEFGEQACIWEFDSQQRKRNFYIKKYLQP